MTMKEEKSIHQKHKRTKDIKILRLGQDWAS